jgi:dynein heavy chain
MPDNDNPLVFGLNPNADLTASLNESRQMLTTLIDTQPSDAAAAGGKSPEETVKSMIEDDFLKLLPDNFKMLEVDDRLKMMKHRRLPETGKAVPLNMFLFQEIQRFQNILGIVRNLMTDMILAIDGQIIMSPELADAIKCMYDLRVPKVWLLDPSGAEISWLAPTLAGWLASMQNRHYQLAQWLAKDRPISYWLTGFFNGQGFLTSVRQEITRAHRADNWALDAVEPRSEVADLRNTLIADDARIEGKSIAEPAEGVWVHGLYLEGAAWNKQQRYLEDSKGKDLFYAFPNIKFYAECPSAENKGPGAPKKAAIDEKNLYCCPVYKYPMR